MKMVTVFLAMLSLVWAVGCGDTAASEKYKAEAQAESSKTKALLETTQKELARSNQELAQALQTIEQLKTLTSRQKEEMAQYQQEADKLKAALTQAQSALARLKGATGPESATTTKDWNPAQLADAQMKEILRALDAYKVDSGSYPTTDQGLKLLLKNKKGSKDPYLKQINKDPWGRDYQYRMANDVCEIRTLGADGKKGGPGEDADIKITGQ
jgi:general secretion pathway protein G